MRLELHTNGWCSGAVVVAFGFGGRLRGRTGESADGLMMRARSLHTVGLSDGLSVIALDDAGQVLSVRQVRPGRLAWDRRATWLVELDGAVPWPPVGSQLSARRRVAGCQAS